MLREGIRSCVPATCTPLSSVRQHVAGRRPWRLSCCLTAPAKMPFQQVCSVFAAANQQQATMHPGTAPRKTLQTVQEMLIEEPQVSLPYLVYFTHGRLRGHYHTCSPSQQRVQRCAKASSHLAGTWRRGGVRTVRAT